MLTHFPKRHQAPPVPGDTGGGRGKNYDGRDVTWYGDDRDDWRSIWKKGCLLTCDMQWVHSMWVFH
ncbi:hypothetical protein BC936DRAFT_137137 [Jimgerdemannia flammicorona]|uniref:Uncharacterized protein n=1 Tax=Jimgerdemannia flammicorona TaxID=994334 RepID=A0A433CY15_9FUNG|nr:hypothetical protein BC936DRAFT_137137 [Jimgerdemannia flammicorona]